MVALVILNVLSETQVFLACLLHSVNQLLVLSVNQLAELLGSLVIRSEVENNPQLAYLEIYCLKVTCLAEINKLVVACSVLPSLRLAVSGADLVLNLLKVHLPLDLPTLSEVAISVFNPPRISKVVVG